MDRELTVVLQTATTAEPWPHAPASWHMRYLFLNTLVE